MTEAELIKKLESEIKDLKKVAEAAIAVRYGIELGVPDAMRERDLELLDEALKKAGFGDE